MSVTSVLGKRERPPFAQHFYPSAPGAMPSVANRASGSQAPPPRLGNIATQSRSTVKYLDTNPTASIPLMLRPWQEHYEKDYAPGSIIFCKQDKSGRSPLITCADVPTMNYLFHEGRNGIQMDKTPTRPEDYEFFGVFRNDAGKQVDHMGFPRYTNPKQRLIQCDVYGRAKVANFWGRKLRTGQRLGLALVVKSTTIVKQPNRHPRNLPNRAYVFQIIPTVNECKVGTSQQLTPAGLPGIGGYLTQRFEVEANSVYIRHWHVGVVSQSAYEPPTDAKISLALHDSQQRTDLPQIEILMI